MWVYRAWYPDYYFIHADMWIELPISNLNTVTLSACLHACLTGWSQPNEKISMQFASS